ncbi:hypothetical protein PROFUN_11064 [Planoprotostelium fungivorum]|uniref:VWFA domain-containing protein n=1 Tax=Planoprotostelium fungivorum TaxID=1890364 RepID=A0A2P6NBP5_9EUKA|nr:hypothetical protein PROFUN_11064 [Planoprotostelium fungivorum]
MLLVFIVDTSASMNQRTSHAGMSMLELAKAAVEHFVKSRVRVSHNDRYFLITCEEGLSAYKCSWNDIKSNNTSAVFLSELKALQAKDLTSIGSCLKKAFEHINVIRLNCNLDNYTSGRQPWMMEPANIIVLTDGGSLTSHTGVTDQLTIPTTPYPGSELTYEPFRWDQRLFTVILQMNGVSKAIPMQTGGPQAIAPGSNAPIISTNTLYSAMSEVTGGNCQIVTTYKMLLAAMDVIARRCEHHGVIINLDNISPSPPGAANNPPNEAKHKMVYVRPSANKAGEVQHWWPLPESFPFDPMLPNPVNIPPRQAHPTIRYNPIDVEPHLIEGFPFDKYEIEMSALTTYMCQFRPNKAWQVFMSGIQMPNRPPEPFGFIKANSTKTAINLHVLPYAYHRLFPLLEELNQFAQKQPSPKWKSDFDRYVQSIPSYYYPYLKTAMKLYGIPHLFPPQYEYIHGPALMTHFKKMKVNSQVESDKIMKAIRQAKESTQSGVNVQVIPKEARAAASAPTSTKNHNFHKLLDKGSNADIYSDSLPKGETTEETDYNEPYSTYNVMVAPSTHRNVFDIPRNELLEQTSRMRQQLSKPNRPSEVLKHMVPIAEMGNYAEAMNAARLREVFVNEEKKAILFGNPFNFRSEKRSTANNLSLGNIVDEADEEEGANNKEKGQVTGKKRSLRPGNPNSPQMAKNKIRKIVQAPNIGTPQKTVQQIGQVVQQTLNIPIIPQSNPPPTAPSTPPSSAPPSMPSSPTAGQTPPSPTTSKLPPLPVVPTNNHPSPTPEANSAIQPPRKNSGLISTDKVNANIRTKNEIKTMIRTNKFSKNYEEIFAALKTLHGDANVKKNITFEIITCARQYKKSELVSQLEAYISSLLQTQQNDVSTGSLQWFETEENLDSQIKHESTPYIKAIGGLLVGSQIRFLLTNLNRKNFKSSTTEIHQLVDQYGHDAYLCLLRSLISNIDLKDQKGQKDQLRIQLLCQEIGQIQKEHNSVSLLSQAFDGITPSEDFILNFSKLLKLPPAQEILVGISLAHSLIPAFREEGIRYLNKRLADLPDSVVKSLPENTLYNLLLTLRTNPLLAQQTESFVKQASRLEQIPLHIAPLLDRDTMASHTEENATDLSKSIEVAGILSEMGPASSDNMDRFREFLQQFPNLKEQDVAVLLGMMARWHVNPSGPEISSNLMTIAMSRETEERVEGQGSVKAWNVSNFVDLMKELHANLNWTEVIKKLDHPGFILHDSKGLALIMSAYRRATQEPFPIEYLFEPWNNSLGQLTFLKCAVSAPPDVFNFTQSSKKVNTEGLNQASKGTTLNQAWQSLSLVEALLRLGERENSNTVRSIFNYPIKHCPEVLALAVSQSDVAWGQLHKDITSVVLPPLLQSSSSSNFIVRTIWEKRPQMLIHGMVELYNKDPSSLPRILEIASQDVRDLPQILQSQPYAFSIELASLAFRREYLDFGKWILDRLQTCGPTFGQACIKHATEKLNVLAKGETAPKLFESLITLYNCLQTNLNHLSNESQEELKQLSPRFQQLITAPPSSGAGTSTSNVIIDESAITTGLSAASLSDRPPQEGDSQAANTINSAGRSVAAPEPRNFPPEVDKEANDLFWRLFNNNMSVTELVSLLERYKNSSTQKEKDICQCMIHNLLDEHQFLPKYPDKELQITAILFGQLIQHQLVSYWALGLALRYILNALKNPPGTKMFAFGLLALQQFRSRIYEWPQFCKHILDIPHLHTSHRDVVEFVEARLNQGNAAGRQETPGMPTTPPSTTPPPVVQEPPAPTPVVVKAPEPVRPSGPPRAVADSSLPSAILVDGLSDTPEIPDSISDKIHFIFNNVSSSNLDVKSVEMRDLLGSQDVLQYVAWYLVLKRVCIEHNYHQLYIAFLDKLKSSELYQYLQAYTLRSIKVLLKSDKIITSIPERSLLKNLGSWMGLMTLSKNKPLLQKDLGLKELLFEAYENGSLIAVIPFVCKVMESCATSKVFKPPNPWVMAILRLLREIYTLPNLRINLKFEIEVLYRDTMRVDINEVKPSDHMKDVKQYTGPNNCDFSPAPTAPSANPAQNAQSNATGGPSMPPGLNTSGPMGGTMLLSGSAVTNAANNLHSIFNPDETSGQWIGQLSSYIHVSAAIPLFTQQPSLKTVVPLAIDRAIREIITPVVDRSVTIASITTRELVHKDFATEGDEQKMRKATHSMVQNLAGSLALVTCKEPLRISMSVHLRNLLQSNTSEQFHGMIESAVQLIASDNLDLACALIEKAATERAVREVDEQLAGAIQLRKRHRESHTNSHFFDQTFFSFSGKRYPANLPDILKPKLGGLAPHQLHVYEDFSRIPHIQSNSTFSGFDEKDQEGGRRSMDQPGMQGQELSISQAVEKFNAILNELENIVSRNPNTSLASIANEPEMASILRSIPFLINQSSSKVEVAMSFARKIFDKLFDNESSLHTEILFSILESISEVYSKLPKEITSWLMYSEEDRKLNRKVVPSLIQLQLVAMDQFDLHLAKLIENQRNKNALDFALFLIRKCTIEGRYLSAQQMRETVDLISKLVRASTAKNQEEILKMLEEAKSITVGPQVKDPRVAAVTAGPLHLRSAEQTNDPAGSREQILGMLSDWVNYYLQPSHNDKALLGYLTQPVFQNILKEEESSIRFYRICLEVTIDSCVPVEGTNGKTLSYGALDAFTKLAVLLVKFAENNNIKTGILVKILNIAIKTLARDHDSKGAAKFDQRPYYRIFSNLITELSLHDPTINENTMLQFLTAFSNALIVTSPLKIPGFAFAWLQLVSDRIFMPKLLHTKSQKMWPYFQRLIVELLKFLEPFLRNAELNEPIRLLYRGTLRVLLILLHDFPEFLCNFHFSFCDVIPASCIQMRNLILSAFPRNMRLPDPFTPNLKVDLLPEINHPPRIMSNYANALNAVPGFKQDLENYLRTRQPLSFLPELRNRLLLPGGAVVNGTRYNVPLINSLVLFVGTMAVARVQSMGSFRIAPNATDIFQQLAVELDTEGRYLFLNAIANQLRYPNSDTHYFSCILLFLFQEAQSEAVQEQITRVLLERIIVNRPHPWGLLITFIELIKNQRFNFWSHSFTRCAPEIERLFDSVARSCMNNNLPKPSDDLAS